MAASSILCSVFRQLENGDFVHVASRDEVEIDRAARTKTMGDRDNILDEIYLLISEQTKALERKLSAEETIECKSRAKRIEELLELIKKR